MREFVFRLRFLYIGFYIAARLHFRMDFYTGFNKRNPMFRWNLFIYIFFIAFYCTVALNMHNHTNKFRQIVHKNFINEAHETIVKFLSIRYLTRG